MERRPSGAAARRPARLLEWFLEAVLILLALGLGIWLVFPTSESDARSEAGPAMASPGALVIRDPAGSLIPWSGKIAASVDDTFARPWHGEFNNRFEREYVRLRPGSWGGLRFLDLPIAQGAHIYEAYIRLFVSGKDNPSILFFGQIGEGSSDFSNIGPVARRRSTASVYWQRHNLGDAWRDTPDLSQILQEIVDEPGWQAGDPMVFLLESTAGSLRFAAWDDDPELAAELFVTYSEQADWTSRVTATTNGNAHPTESVNSTAQATGESTTPSASPTSGPGAATPAPATATPTLTATQIPAIPTAPPSIGTATPTGDPPSPTDPPPTATATLTDPPMATPTGIPQEASAFGGPIQINSSNYDAYHSTYRSSGPFVVRATVLEPDRYARSLNEIARIHTYGENIADYRIGFGSVGALEGLLIDGEGQQLRDLGVTTLTYNPEGAHTPAQEFGHRFDASEANPIVQFARLAQEYGFRAVWAPLRTDADRIGDGALMLIYASGLDGLALQEQRFIENACVDTRLDAVEATLRRHEQIAGRSLELTVQIMSSRCAAGDALMVSCGEGANIYQYQHCDMFVEGLVDHSMLDVLSIWPNGNEASLIETIR